MNDYIGIAWPDIPSLIGTISPAATGSDFEPYDEDESHPYEFTPSATEDQIIPTAGKGLSEDIIIHKIPYIETSNPTNGKTVYIATN